MGQVVSFWKRPAERSVGSSVLVAQHYKIGDNIIRQATLKKAGSRNGLLPSYIDSF